MTAGLSSGESPGRRPFAVAHLTREWYVACRSRDLGRVPIARTILGETLVLFRDGTGRAAALLDRCAHRNLPLSRGHVVAGLLECAYHGWRYDGDGVCRVVPCLGPNEDSGKGRVPSHAVREQQGFVWVFAGSGAAEGEPFSFPHVGEPGCTTATARFRVEATLLATLENQLDVPHTAFLHRGLFRNGAGNEITAIVRRWGDRVEAEYVGEPRPSGLAGRLLAPEGGTVAHFDRFILPSIAQVEYRLGERSHLSITNALTPESDFVTRFHTVISFRLPLPHLLVRAVLTPVARWINAQDARILRQQTETVRRFGEERYTSTAIDLLGPHMWRLLKESEGGRPRGVTGEPTLEKAVRLVV
jgi:phenylpropionate dioxygenase-like ring-hydroxylating dioxygenase large terminal subunit